MQWFKHDSDANMDGKLQEVLLDYGLEGYGLYWYCLELICSKITANNINFELEHDARVIARNTGSSVQKVQEMMKKFVSIGLFESNNGFVTCYKLAKRIDQSMSGNPKMRELIRNIKSVVQNNQANQQLENNQSTVMTQSTDSHDSVMQEENRIEENRIEKNNTKDMSVSPKHDESVKEVFQHWQTVMNSPRSKLGDDRKKQIAKALKTYSVEELKKAITGCSMTPFNMGDNDQKTKYNGLDLILRNSEKIDKFISHADNPPATMKKQAIRQTGFNCAGLNNGGKTEL
jgi:hypothetical protein